MSSHKVTDCICVVYIIERCQEGVRKVSRRCQGGVKPRLIGGQSARSSVWWSHWYWMSLSFALNEPIICTEWNTHWYWMGTLIGTEWEHSLVLNGDTHWYWMGRQGRNRDKTTDKKSMEKRRGRLGITFATYLQKVYANFAEVKRHLGITHEQDWGFCTRFALSLQRHLSITHKKAWGLWDYPYTCVLQSGEVRP